MKQNLKLLSVVLLIILSGCQEENIYQQNQPNRLTVKSITYGDAKEVKLLDNALTKMFNGIKSHKSNNKNTTPVEDNDFTIDQSAKVKVMSDGNSTTYTMLIKRAIEDPQYFENLVVKIDNDSQPKAYLFKYIPSEESHYVFIHKEFSFKGNFEVHEIIYNSSVFQPLVNLSGCGKIALCDVEGVTHNAGENCTGTYYVLGNCDANTPDSGGGSQMPYTAPVGNGGGAVLQGNVLKMNGFITTMSFPKQEVFATLPQGTQDAIFNYLVTNNFLNGSTFKVSNFLQSMISNNVASYLLGDISATTINPNIEPNANNIFNNLIQNNFSTQSVSFSLWAFNYLSQNPNVTAQQFKNWFMGSSEGLDGTFDETYWNNPSLTFPSQNLPTMDDFLLAFPSHFDALYDTPLKMYSSIGGVVATYYSGPLSNTCAIRVSKALNYSNITIPNLPGKTFKGADNKYYFLVAANLLSWMKKTFGTPTGSNHLTGAQGGNHGENFPALLQGKEGIYILVPNITGGCDSGTGFCATGHADMYIAGDCDGHCYFNATGGVKEIFFWVLP